MNINNKIIIILLLFTNILYSETLNIDQTTKRYDLLTHASIYIDNTNKLSIDEIKNKQNLFKKNDKNILGYGYSPGFTVWLKFTLKNTSAKPLYKLLEYGNTLTTNMTLYDGYKRYSDGLLSIN